MWFDEPEPELRYLGWPGGAKVAVTFELILEAWRKLPPVSTALTPTFPKAALDAGLTDHATVSWQLFGGRTGFSRLTTILRQYEVPASVICSAMAAERWPEQVAEFAAGGNEILAHCYSQDHRMYFMDEEADRAEIRLCADIIAKVSGQRPVGWSSPGGQRGDHTVGNLLKEGFLYCSDFSDAEVPYIALERDGKRLLALAGSSVNDVNIFRQGHSPATYVDVFRRMIDQLRSEGETRPAMMTAIVHSTHLGRPHGGSALRECLDYARSFDDVWICRPRDIAEHYASQL